MKKLLIILSATILAIAILVVAAWWWLTATRGGAEWLLGQATRVAPGLSWQRLEGGLAGGITVHGLVYEAGDLRVTVNRAELAVRVTPLPTPRVRVHWLRARDIDIMLPAGDETATEPFVLPDELTSPVAVRLDELRLDNIRIHGPDEAGDPLVIDRVSLEARVHDRLEVEALRVEALGWQLRGRADLAMAQPYDVDLELTASGPLQAARDQQARIAVTGPLDRLEFQLQSRGALQARARGRVSNLPDTPEIEAQVHSDQLGWPEVPVTLENLSLELAGSLEGWQLDARFVSRADDFPEAHWALALRGDSDHIRLHEGRIETLGGHIDATGRMALDDDLQARARVTLNDLNLTALYPEWPAQAPLQGALELSYQAGAIDVSTLTLSAPPTPLEVNGSARIDPVADELVIDLEWRDFVWPPVTGDQPPLIESSRGTLRADGALSDWRMELSALLASDAARDAGEASLELEARGNEAQAELTRLHLESGTGALTGHGWLRWHETLAGSLSLRLQALDPGAFSPALPGRLDGELRLDMGYEQALDLVLTVDRLEGELRGQPVAGHGRLEWVADAPGAAALDLSMGDNRVVLEGDGTSDWSYRLDAEALHQLWPGLAGGATLSGRANPAVPALSASGDLREIAWQGYRLQHADIELDWSMAQTESRLYTRLHLSALDLSPWERLDVLNIESEGSCQAHALRLQLEGRRVNLELAGDGTLPACPPGFEQWSLEWQRFNLSARTTGAWQLAAPAPMTVDASGALDLRAFCLNRADAEPGALCLNELTAGDQALAVDMRITDLPLDLLLLAADTGFSVGSHLNGDLQLAWRDGRPQQLQGQILAGPGAVRRTRGRRDTGVSIEGGRLELSSPAPETVRAELRIDVEGGTQLTGEADISQFTRIEDAQLAGTLALQVPELGHFVRLVPEVDELAGALRLSLTASGDLTRPWLDGALELNDGLVTNVPLGMRLSDIQIASHSEPGAVLVDGRFRAGEGQGHLSARIGIADGQWTLESRLRGESLELFAVDWLRMRISPDLGVTMAGDQIDIDGRLDIPHGRLGLPPGTAERVYESADVVVLGEHPETTEETAPAVQLSGSLVLGLGNDVVFSGAGARTNLTGEVTLNWTNGQPIPRGRGTIRLEDGAYRAYGQNLTITDGAIIFGNRPVDNPRLRIRAVREIFADPLVEEAGVLIDGFARNPQISVFTVPPTNEEKALAYIATGSDFDHATGVGAFSMGFYLFPRLFVSYGIGLFETGNVLSARYELSRRWGIRAESGERDTGVDFSYIIDR